MFEKKIKIIYCITKSNWGGAQRYVYDLATSLPIDKYDVSVLFGADGFLAQKLRYRGIRTIILDKLARDTNFIKDFLVLIKLFKIFRLEKPDIIHLNSSKVGLLGALAGRLSGVPKIIFTGHGWAFNEERSKFQKKIIRLLHLLTIRLCHVTIAVSEQTKRQIAKSKYYDKKIVVIKNGLENIDFYSRESAQKKILERITSTSGFGQTGRKWLGTVSELHKNKGLKYLIEAIHLLDIKIDDRSLLPLVIIIGDGEKKEKLQQRIARYNLNDTIFLVGRIEEAEKYLRAFDIFTLTSITEALPYAILEAGQAGLPIIASNVGGIPEIIDDMKNGILIPPKEPVEILKAINILLTQTDKMTEFGRNIENKIQKYFNKETMVKKTIELYLI